MNPRIVLLPSRLRHGVCRFGAFNSLRRDLEHPGQNKRDRQTENDEQNNQSNDPVWNVEDWKNLRDSLRERPAGHNVSDRDLVNIAPLQLGEKIPAVHSKAIDPLNSLAGRIFSASASKRASPCSGRRSGSTRTQSRSGW